MAAIRRAGPGRAQRYFDWAAPRDDFESILADEDVWAPVLDPLKPGYELGTPDGRPIRYFGRLDQLISDAQDEYWVVCHRLVWDGWADDQALIDDGEARRGQWAVETAYPQLVVAGAIYNELRMTVGHGAPPAVPPADLRDMTRGVRHLNVRRSAHTPPGKDLTLPLPDAELNRVYAPAARSGDQDRVDRREGDELVRRTWVRRARSSAPEAHREVVAYVLQAREPTVDVSPDPSEEKCSQCAFLKPCIAMNDGVDIGPIMVAEFRKRTEDEFEEEGLRWSPNRRAQRASLGGGAERPQTVNFRWA